LEIDLEGLGSLFDQGTSPAFPHTGPMLNSAVAKFMIDTVRADRRSPDIGITVTLHAPPLRPEEVAGSRAQMSSFFANEAETAALTRRVNSTEAWGSLRYALPVLVVAGLVLGVLTSPSTFGLPVYLTELAYLIVLVIIWVMVWDPIEKLLFDSYFIRLRIRALNKLAAAKVVFVYRQGVSPAAKPTPVDPSPLDSIHAILEG
jgi:hypothetical protein